MNTKRFRDTDINTVTLNNVIKVNNYNQFRKYEGTYVCLALFSNIYLTVVTKTMDKKPTICDTLASVLAP